MTPLQTLILSELSRRGPQSDMSLWANARRETLKAVLVAAAILAEEKFIERAPANKILQRYPAGGDTKYWQLTQKGHEYVAANLPNVAQKEESACLRIKEVEWRSSN